MSARRTATPAATLMVLAAGEGRRLQPLTHTVPKPLVPVHGTPLLLRTLRALRRFEFARTVVNVHHLAGQIERTVGASEFAGRVALSHEATLLGTGGGIHHALGHWQGDAAWIWNGDVVCDADLRAHEAAIPATSTAHMILRPLPPGADRAGAVYLAAADVPAGGAAGRPPMSARRVVGVRMRGDLGGEAHAFTGIHWLRRDAAAKLGEPGDVIADGYVPWIVAGAVTATVHHGYWIDIGTADALLRLEADVRQGTVAWGG